MAAISPMQIPALTGAQASRSSPSASTRGAQITQENVGRPFAIVLDNEIVSAPIIREPILGGTGQISGNFTVESANNLAILMRGGMFPARLTVVEQQVIEAKSEAAPK
jgi:preprotein translocase subunit SecD